MSPTRLHDQLPHSTHSESSDRRSRMTTVGHHFACRLPGQDIPDNGQIVSRAREHQLKGA
jgi:hypothetical protein